MSAISVRIVLAAYAYGVSRVETCRPWRVSARARRSVSALGLLALLVAFSPWMHDLSERRLFAQYVNIELLHGRRGAVSRGRSPVIGFCCGHCPFGKTALVVAGDR